MVWKLEKIEDVVVLRYNPSMLTFFFLKDEWERFTEFFSGTDEALIAIGVQITSAGNYYSFSPSVLDNGHKIVEMYFADKGIAFVIFMEYFESLIELCRKEAK